MRLYVVRHALTDYNVKGLIQGNDVGRITATGMVQLQQLAKLLARERIDHVLCSSADRCLESAKVLLDGQSIEVEQTALARERDSGDTSGMPIPRVDWAESDEDFETRRPPNGESFVDVKERMLLLLNDNILPLLKEGQNILLVSHAEFIKVLTGYILGLTIRDALFNLRIDNATFSEFRLDPRARRGISLYIWNEIPFVADLRIKYPYEH